MHEDDCMGSLLDIHDLQVHFASAEAVRGIRWLAASP